MKKVIIIKTGDTFPAIENQMGDFEDWIGLGLGINKEAIMLVDVPRDGDLPTAEACKGVVIAGSHAMVTQNLSWSIKIEQWLPQVIQSNVPVLGICYGHQLLAKAMGGTVDYHAGGLEIGTVRIDRLKDDTQDPLFRGLPESFAVHACHSQTVVKLPDNAVRIAHNAFEPHHAFRIGECAWGLQFHPEYDEAIMKAYAVNMETLIKESGLSLPEILDQINPTPVALKILNRFGKLVE